MLSGLPGGVGALHLISLSGRGEAMDHIGLFCGGVGALNLICLTSLGGWRDFHCGMILQPSKRSRVSNDNNSNHQTGTSSSSIVRYLNLQSIVPSRPASLDLFYLLLTMKGENRF